MTRVVRHLGMIVSHNRMHTRFATDDLHHPPPKWQTGKTYREMISQKYLNTQRMKKICLFFIGSLLMGCGQPEAESVQLTGQVENPTGNKVEVFYYTDHITNATHQTEAILDENDSFEALIPMSDPHFVHLRIPRRTITMYLEPGATLHIAFDAEDPDVLPAVTGDRSLESSFLLSYNMDVERKYGQMTLMNKALELDPGPFVSYVEMVYDEKQQYMRYDPRYEELDPSFVSLMRSNMRFEKYNHLMEYPFIRAQFHPEGEVPVMPDGYHDFLDEPGLFKDVNPGSSAYVNFLNIYLHHYMEENVPEDGYNDQDYMVSRYNIAGEILTGDAREVALAHAVVSMLRFEAFEKAVEYHEDFMNVVTSERYRAIVQREYENVSRLAPGNPAPGFTLKDIDGEEVSLDDFLGKVVYLDFWASWCGPCMQQVPYARELKERFSDHDDLVFLYISVDTDEAAWRRTVNQHDIQGVHLNVAGFNHEVPASYNLQGVPTFYLIGRDGNIINSRPPRPSHENIDVVLLAALDKQ